MSDIVQKQYPPDMSLQEQEALKEFVESGLPGIASIKDDQIKQAMELYFNGATYQEISVRVGIKKAIITYLSDKFDWYGNKTRMLESMLSSLPEKTEIAHGKSIDLITDLMSSIEFYYRDIVDNYRKSKDPRILDSIDLEKMKLYMKCMEQIQKYRQPPKDPGKQPLMGLSLPNGGTLKKIDDNTIEVSNNNSQVKDAELSRVLSVLANLRRERESKK